MKLKLLLVGKTAEDYLQRGISVYSERISHYVSFEMVVIPDLKQTASLTQKQIKEKEGELILKNVRNGDFVILLDEHGKVFSSLEWARDLQQRIAHLSTDLVFVIGGPYGFSDKVRQRADDSISLSRMTFSHQLVRVIFLEQLYRAFTIIRGEPYHHE